MTNEQKTYMFHHIHICLAMMVMPVSKEYKGLCTVCMNAQYVCMHNLVFSVGYYIIVLHVWRNVVYDIKYITNNKGTENNAAQGNMHDWCVSCGELYTLYTDKKHQGDRGQRRPVVSVRGKTSPSGNTPRQTCLFISDSKASHLCGFIYVVSSRDTDG